MCVLLHAASLPHVVGIKSREDERFPVGFTLIWSSSSSLFDLRCLSFTCRNCSYEIFSAKALLRAPKFQEKIQGRAEVREVINNQKVGVIAGCHVISGIIQRHSSARLIRDSVVVYEGKIDSLRRFKDDVKEVASGFECGISLDKFQDLKRGDIVEPFSVEEVLP